jgi:choline kinase
MQALILAAGMGKRLKELTRHHTKCMVEVNGVTLIERMLSQLDDLNLSVIVIVVGYHQKTLIDFIESLDFHTPITYIHNEIYDQTNNIYSLYLAKEILLKEDTILLESDLILEDAVLKRIVDNPYPNLALVAKYENWMDGTVVTLDQENQIETFLGKNEFVFANSNIYPELFMRQ